MNLKTLIKKYKKLGLKDSQLLYINADFGNIINDISFNKEDLLSLHYTAIKKIIGRNGTIVVPTATLNLCGTKKVFLPNITKSHQMGAFSEYVRKKRAPKDLCIHFGQLQQTENSLTTSLQIFLNTLLAITLYFIDLLIIMLIGYALE